MSGVFLSAQETSLKFNEEVHDFGIIKEQGGSVNCTFEFENIDNVPVIIQSVKASCGCTTPLWTREPILPGRKGVVKARFNPRNRRGAFSKSVTVSTNLGVKRLIIKGEVAPRPKTLSDLYPKRMGSLRVKTAYVMFNEISKVKQDTVVIEAVNDSEEDIIVSFGKLPDYLKIKTKSNLKPREKTTIKIIYDAAKTSFYGFKNDIIPVLVNEKERNSNSFVITATVLDDFSEMTEEQKENAPIVELDKANGMFKDTSAGKTVKVKFKIKNIGKDTLFIRNVDCSSKALKTSLMRMNVPSNEECVMKVLFDTTDKKGYQNEQISLITNSPSSPIVNFRISGIIFD